jgi:hypothetical protein
MSCGPFYKQLRSRGIVSSLSYRVATKATRYCPHDALACFAGVQWGLCISIIAIDPNA